METQFDYPIMVCSNIAEFRTLLFTHVVNSSDFCFDHISNLQDLISNVEYKPNHVHNINFNGKKFPVILKEYDNWVKTSLVQ